MNKTSGRSPILIVVVVLIIAIAIAAAVRYSHKSTPVATATPTMIMPTSSPVAASPVATTSPAAAAAADTVTIQNFAFAPTALTVKVGTTVTWINQDSVSHTVTGDTSGGPQSNLLSKGQSYSFTFAKAGTFSYHCTPHPYMKASVVVTP